MGSLAINTNEMSVLFSVASESKNKVIWVRDPNFDKQLFLSDNYEKIWARARNELIINPQNWNDYLLGDKNGEFVKLLKSQLPENANDQVNYIAFYKILLPNGTVKFIKDHHFHLFDQANNLAAVAGIAEPIQQLKWDAEKNSNDLIYDKENMFFQKQIAKILDKGLYMSSSHIIPLHSNEYTGCRSIITEENEKIYLSKREIEILHYFSLGNSAKIIARNLNISYRTVEKHIYNIKDKIKIRTIIELLAKVKGYSE